MKAKPDILYPVNQLISQRWSPRAFSSKAIPQSDVMSLFEACRWAASSMNEQPWRFIYAQKSNPEAWDNLLSLANEWNRSWSKTADLLILTIAKMQYDHKNYPNEHALYDLGLGLGNLSTQATSLGIFLHHMGGFDPERAIELYSIPEGYKPVSLIAAGYPGSIESIPEEIAKTEYEAQTRIPTEEFAFEGFFKS